MKTIQIRNVPDQVHRRLRARAAGADLSLSDYILHELVRLASLPSIAEVLERAGNRHGGAHKSEIVAVVRGGRERK